MTNKETKHLTQDELQKKADELTAKYGTKVEPIEFIDEETNEQIIGYIKTPSLMVKARIMDKAIQGTFTAALELLDAVLLVEESDKKLSSDKLENDSFRLGAGLAAFATITVANNLFKKK